MNGDERLRPHERRNRESWNKESDEYEGIHAAALSGELAMAWGLWRLPESELHILGDVEDRDVLEYGCGAARWCSALAKAGARPVGLDLSARQLEHARRLQAETGVSFPLIEASAEDVPLPDSSFDIVFCDWGAMTFADPYRTVPEVARLLRPGGLFAFSTGTPIAAVCESVSEDRLTRALVNDYFGLHTIDWGDYVNFQIPYGEWIRLFREAGLVVEDLIETRPEKGQTSTYRTDEENEWARHWPMENIWRVRKPAR
jgi:SAM-dependent methyltransferase